MSWLKKKKKNCFQVSSCLIQCISKPFLHWIVPCNEKWVFYNDQRWSAKWLHRGETPKHFSQPNFHQKKVTVTVWWSAASLIRYSFLNPIQHLIFFWMLSVSVCSFKKQCLIALLVCSFLSFCLWAYGLFGMAWLFCILWLLAISHWKPLSTLLAPSWCFAVWF